MGNLLMRHALNLCLLPCQALRWLVDRAVAPLWIRARGVRCGKGLRLYGIPFVSRHPDASITLGEGVCLRSRRSANMLCAGHPCTLAAIAAAARLEIGHGVGMSGATLVAASSIRIGDRTLIGAEAAIIDTDFHPLSPDSRRIHPTQGAVSQGVTVGSDVFIGMRAMILKGVTVGNGAVIGAGAVVTKDVVAGAIVAGNPARVVGSVQGKSQVGDQDGEALVGRRLM